MREAGGAVGRSGWCGRPVQAPCMLPTQHHRAPTLQLCVTDLGRWLAQRPSARLSEREAAHILRQLLASLAACHRHGLAYRDVKPQNLVSASCTLVACGQLSAHAR